MDLQSQIKQDLWKAINRTYDAGNYSHAVIDAMHYLSSILREKSGVDGDGVVLVGQALGGDAPRLRINKLQTETEKNEQHGIENILRGMYQAVRNPRSHEQISDTKDNADAIICFIDFLLERIEKSEEPFVSAKFLRRVFDPDFYQSQQYSELLINEVPANKRFDILVTIYRSKLDGEIYNIGFVIRTLMKKLSDEQLKNYLAIVSEELSTITDEKEIRYNIHLLSPDLWPRISELSKLRIENRIIRCIKEGKYDFISDESTKGVLAAWANDHLQYFSLKDQVNKTLFQKLESDDLSSRHFIIKWFFRDFPNVITSPYDIDLCVDIISRNIREFDNYTRQALTSNINTFPDVWIKKFYLTLKDLTDADNPEIYLRDGSPFLKTNSPNTEDDIPF